MYEQPTAQLTARATSSNLSKQTNTLFNGLFSRTTWVSWHQKADKPFWILMKQETIGWQWHQLDHMQIICTSSLNYLQAGCSSWCSTNSIKALKIIKSYHSSAGYIWTKIKCENWSRKSAWTTVQIMPIKENQIHHYRALPWCPLTRTVPGPSCTCIV